MESPAAVGTRNVVQSDIDHHAKFSRDWWDAENGPVRGLHSYNVLRIPFVTDGLVDKAQRQTDKPLKGFKILDVGCGGGIVSEALAGLGASVTGVDAGDALVRCARGHALANPALAGNTPQYICTTIEEHAKTHANHYDAVVASEIIEHVEDKMLFVESCVKTLKPGGRIFFTTPNRTTFSHIYMIILAEDVFRQIPKGTHQIEMFTTPVELTNMLNKCNCQVEKISGIFQDFIECRWHWIESCAFLFALQAVKTSDGNRVKSKI